jgi:hypothetical protein
MLLFLRMDFLLKLMGESALDNDTLEGSVWIGWRFFVPDSRGP